MKNIILLFVCVLFLYPVNIAAQNTVMKIGPASVGSGDTVAFPIIVSNFNNVGAISLKIFYDTLALTYIGITNSPPSISFLKNATGGAVFLGWFDATASTPFNIEKGKLVDILFTGNGKEGKLNFDTSDCEISNDTGKVIPVTFKKSD